MTVDDVADVDCARCKGPMTEYDKRWGVKGIHADVRDCAAMFEKRVKELEIQFSTRREG